MADIAVIRNNSEIVKGDELWLFIGVGGAKPVAYATTCSLNMQMSTQSISSKDHGSTSNVIPGEGSWTASTEALYAQAGGTGAAGTPGATGAVGFGQLLTAYKNSSKVDVIFGYVDRTTNSAKDNNIVGTDASSSTPTHAEWIIANGWSGQGYITSLQATGAHGESATFSCEIAGLGPLNPYSSTE